MPGNCSEIEERFNYNSINKDFTYIYDREGRSCKDFTYAYNSKEEVVLKLQLILKTCLVRGVW